MATIYVEKGNKYIGHIGLDPDGAFTVRTHPDIKTVESVRFLIEAQLEKDIFYVLNREFGLVTILTRKIYLSSVAKGKLPRIIWILLKRKVSYWTTYQEDTKNPSYFMNHLVGFLNQNIKGLKFISAG